MVLPGQFLERPALVSCGDLTLEGLSHRGRRAPALLLCPPVEEAGMDAPAIAELAWALARAGHASLRFQYRGCGASSGTRDPGQAGADAEAALAHLAETAPGPLAVAGLGSGCLVALGLLGAHPELAAGILVAPRRPFAPPGSARLLVVLPENGSELAPDEVAPPPGPAGGLVVEVVAGADPAFRSGLPALGHLAVQFLSRSWRPQGT